MTDRDGEVPGFTLQDLLDLPLMRSSRPHVIAGDGFEHRPVRWVHTSEIFEISPLLKGGEVLFTTGLGLVGSPAGSITAYVASLASQNVTALIMEVGRTFVQLPDEFSEAARRHGLPLITMHQVVPFVEITEIVHPLLISHEVGTLRRSDHAFRQLIAGVLAGDDLGGLLAIARRLTGAPIGLYSAGGQLLAGDDVRREHAPTEIDEVPVGPEPWAVLAMSPSDEQVSTEVAHATASVVALKLSQKMTGSPSRALAVADLVGDMLRGNFSSSQDVEARAASLGFVMNPRRQGVALFLDLTRSARTGLAAVTKAARRGFGPNLVAEIDDRIVVLVQLRAGEPFEEQLRGLARSVDQQLASAGTGRVVRVVAGPVAESFAGLATSLARAQHGARLARRLAFPARVVTDRDLGLYDLLTRVVPDADLETFVEQQLGPLLQADARSGHRLVETLNAYLEVGRSKTAAAEVLGVRRQTMYLRLERISALLGGLDLGSHDRLTALDLAVTAWRMRTSGLTGTPAR